MRALLFFLLATPLFAIINDGTRQQTDNNATYNWVGSFAVDASSMGCPGTDAVDGADTPAVLTQMATPSGTPTRTATLTASPAPPSATATPTFSRTVSSTPTANDAHNGIPLTTTAINLQAALQYVHDYGESDPSFGPPEIWVYNEIERPLTETNPVSITDMNIMIADKVAWARAQGWSNKIRFADVYASVTPGIGPDLPDGGHPSMQGCQKIQASAAPQLFP